MSNACFSRRRFLACAAVGSAMGTIALSRGESATAPSEPEKPLFRFVQWNDIHIDATTPSDYKLANEKAKYLVESLNAAALFPVPDFVIGVGDIINGEDLASLAPDLALFKKLTADLKCPYYPVVGNHEVVQQEGNPQYEAPYRQAFGDDRTNYTFRHGGVQFVVLDDSGRRPRTAPKLGVAATVGSARCWRPPRSCPRSSVATSRWCRSATRKC